MDHPVATLGSSELTTVGLSDAVILDCDGATIATVSHVEGVGLAACVIAKTCGFLGFGATTVAIPLRDLNFCRTQSGGIQAASGWDFVRLKETFAVPA
jgi:hypothetical protein